MALHIRKVSLVAQWKSVAGCRGRGFESYLDYSHTAGVDFDNEGQADYPAVREAVVCECKIKFEINEK